MIRRRDALKIGGAGLALPVVGLRPALAVPRLDFSDLYVREMELTAIVQAIAGQRVEMFGFMAPPLKAEASFFVLTSVPMATCPFCETEAQWPDDIVLVLTRNIINAVGFNRPIRAEGVLDLGFETDAETGFVSLIRLEDARFELA
jgi:hypothetical protein